MVKERPGKPSRRQENRTDIIAALQIHSLNFEDLWVVNVLAEAVHVWCLRAVACDGRYTGDTQRARRQKKPAHSDLSRRPLHALCVYGRTIKGQGSPCHLAMAITPQPHSRSAFLRLPRTRGVAGNVCMFGGSSGQISRLTGQLWVLRVLTYGKVRNFKHSHL